LLAGKNDRNLRRIHKTVNDIAGTTGRAAPLIRNLSTLSSTLSLGSVPKKQLIPQTTSIGQTNSPNLNSKSQARDLQSVTIRKSEPRNPQTVMVIADEFTAAAFESEWYQVRPTPDSWRTALDEN